jgi:protein-disulfide isomerase
MKSLIILALLVVTLSATFSVRSAPAADDRVQIFLYFESLCPYCREFMTGSFKDAVYTQDFQKICDYQIFPYGNARQV